MKSFLIFILCASIGGTGWIFIPSMRAYHLDEVILSQRFFIAGTFLFILGKYNKECLSFKAALYSLLNGFLLFCINYLFAFKAINYLPTGLVALSLALICIPNIIFGSIILGKKVVVNDTSSALLMVTGILMLYLPLYKVNLLVHAGYGFVLCLISTISTSLGNMIISKKTDISNTYLFLGLSMIYGSIFIFLFMIISGQNVIEVFSVKSYSYVAMLVYVSLVCTALIYALYAKLIKKVGPVKASFVWLVSPFVAIFLSILYENYKLDLFMVIGALIYILGGMSAKGINKPASFISKILNSNTRKIKLFLIK